MDIGKDLKAEAVEGLKTDSDTRRAEGLKRLEELRVLIRDLDDEESRGVAVGKERSALCQEVVELARSLFMGEGTQEIVESVKPLRVDTEALLDHTHRSGIAEGLRQAACHMMDAAKEAFERFGAEERSAARLRHLANELHVMANKAHPPQFRYPEVWRGKGCGK